MSTHACPTSTMFFPVHFVMSLCQFSLGLPCSWLCRQDCRGGASGVSEVESAASVEHKYATMGCCCRVQSLFLPLLRCSFWNRIYNYKVYHCSKGNILELSCCKKSCLLWVCSIHVWVIPCQIIRFLAIFSRTPSDSFEIWHACRNCLETNIRQFFFI